MRTDVPSGAVGQGNPQRDFLADKLLQFDASVLRNEVCLETEQLRNRLAAAEAEELQFLLGRQWRIEGEQALMLGEHRLEGVRNHFNASCIKLEIYQ
ncbi:hypothetical protein D3C79_970770 [compost metagenome]